MLFTYKANLIPKDYFQKVYDQIIDKVGSNNSERKSCVYNLHDINFKFDYGIPFYSYKDIPKCLEEIRTIVEKDSGTIFDYLLIHLYSSGKSSINYHSDKEAKKSTIASVTLGATRKFRLKEIGKKSGYDFEFSLSSGDCIYMHPGCQEKYLHTVPKELRVTEPRINLTFRQFELN